MEVKIRHKETVEVDSFRVLIHGNEFQFIEKPDGLHIFEVTDDVIMIQPRVANSVILITKEKDKRKK